MFVNLERCIHWGGGISYTVAELWLAVLYAHEEREVEGAVQLDGLELGVTKNNGICLVAGWSQTLCYTRGSHRKPTAH